MLRNLYIKEVERLFISVVLNKELNVGQYLIVHFFNLRVTWRAQTSLYLWKFEYLTVLCYADTSTR